MALGLHGTAGTVSGTADQRCVKSRMAIRGGTGTGFLTDTAINEYVRCYTLKTITGSCRDYRATATCDFEMDTADKDKKIDTPLLLLWGA
jgi:haloacetate dehalogenase